MTDHVGRSERLGRYRYTATIQLVIYADGQDIAWRVARKAASAASVAGVESAVASTMDLRYRQLQAPPVGASGEHTPRGRS